MKIPKRFAESVSLEALAEGVFRCHGNAIRLATAAELLLDNGLYASCINTCRLAVEELAKAHLLTQGASYKNSDRSKWAWIWASFTNHKEKLRIIEYELSWPSH